MNEKLLQLVYSKMKTKASYDDFKKDFQSNPDLQRLAYSKLKTDASFEAFQRDALGGGEVKKKDIPQVPQTPVQTGGEIPQQNAGSVGSLVGGSAPTPQDIASQSVGGNVASPVVLPEPTKINESNIPIQGVQQPVDLQVPEKQTFQQETVETTIPTASLGQIESAERNARDQKTILELDQDKEVFNKVMDDIKSKYSPEEIARGEYIDEAKELFKKNAKYTDLNNLEDLSLNSANYFDEQLRSPQRQFQESFGDLELRKTIEANPDVFNQTVMSPDEMSSDFGQELKNMYGDDVTVGESLFLDQNDFDTKNLMSDKYAELTGDELGLGFTQKARSLYLKDVALNTQKEILNQGSQLFRSSGSDVIDPQKMVTNSEKYYRDYMAQKAKSFMSPFDSDFYDKVNELESLINKNKGKDISDSDIQKIVALQSSLKEFQASGENQIYNPIDGKYHIKNSPSLGPEAGLWAKEVNDFKKQYSDVGISKLREDLDRSILEYDELNRINSKYSSRGINTGFAPVSKELQDKKKQIQALTELMTYNYNPAKDYDSKPGLFGGVGRGAYRELTGKDYKGDYEENLYAIEKLQEAGMPINKEIKDYMTQDDMARIGESLGGSVVAGGKIGLEIALGNKLKGFMKIPELIEKVSGGNSLKKRILDHAFDANMYGTSYQLAGESYATGVGEYLGEGLGRKISKTIKLNPDGLSSLAVEWATGNLSEMNAELLGELADRLVSGEGVEKSIVSTLGLDTKEGLSGKLKELALHTVILSGGPMSAKAVGLMNKRRKYLSEKENPTKEDKEELELIDENLDSKKVEEISLEALNNEDIAAKYNEIKDKQDNELSSEEKVVKENINGIIDGLPKDKLAETKVGQQLEIEFPKDKLQEQRDKVAGIEQQKIEKNDQKDQGRVSGEVKVGEEPVKEKPIEETSPKETEAGGVLQAQEEVELITADVTNLKSEVDNVAEGMNPMAQKKVFDALTDYTEQVATETDLKGGKLIEEVANRIDQNEELNLTKDDILESKEELIDIIKQKQKQNESKRIRDNQNGETKNAEGTEERVQLEEQRRGSETNNGNTEGQTGQRVSGTQQEVIKDTEEQLTSPPPEKEMGEASVDAEKIKKVGKTFADTIRKAKIPNELGNIKSSVGIDIAWNTAVEAAALSVEAGASIAQAVSNGVSKLKESDWYKNLSEEGKKQAESFVSNKLNEEYKNAEKKIVEETKKETPPPKPPKQEAEKEGSPRQRRKQFFNRAKKDTTIDERTRRFLNEADEMYEVESNKWANADADRLIEAYEREGKTDELFEDIKSGDGMSESVQAMLALKLARRLDSQNKNKEASKVYEWIDETARGSGRFIQALREQASPDGVKRAKEAEWKEQKTQAMDGKTASKQNTNEEVVNDAKTGTDTAVSNFNENIDKNTDIDNAVKNVANKSVKRKETASRRARKNVNKEKAYRNKLKDDFKKNKGNYLSMSATGLSSSGIEYAGNIAASYIRQGVYNVAEIIANVKEFFKNELEYELTNEDVSQIAGKIASDEKIIKENLETTIKDIVKNHFNNKEEYGKRLAEKLKEEAGLSDLEAKYLEDQVMQSFDDAVRKTMEEELKRMFNRAQNNGTPKRVKTFTERVIDAYRYGALDNSKFADQFGEYFGFVSLTNEDKVQISKLAEALETAPEGSHIQKKMMGEFSKHLDELDKKGWKFKAKEMAKTAIEFWYTSILSGFTTLYRGAKGIIQTSTADMFVEALKNPRLFFSPKGFVGGLDALAKGFKKGFVTAREIMRSGYNAMDSANKLELTPSKLNDFINKKQKGVWNNTVKLWYYLPTKMVRALIASDALLKMASKDLYAYTKNYNVLLTEGMDRKSKDFWNEMNNRMANSKADYDIALEEARGEKKAMEDAGVSTKGFNEKLRAYEILEEKRDISVNEYSTWKAEKAGINQTPQGLVGSFYEMITTKLERFPLGKLVVPFTRIPSNAMNMWLDWSPWGFKRAAFGYGTGMSRAKTEKKLGTAKVKEMMIGTQDMTADDRIELLIKATIGTATWGVLFWQMGLGDDDENKFVDLSYNGYGDYKENESLRKQGWRPYSMRLKIGGKWSDWIEYRDAPMGFVFSSLSSVNDELKYGKEKKDKLTKADTQDLILHGLTHSLLFVKEQNYMQGVSNLMKAFEGKGVGSKLGKYGVDTQTDFVKSILFPNTYKQSYGTYKALTGKPQNIKTRFNEGILKYSFQRMVSDVPFLEDMKSANEGEMFDVLGYPIVRKIRDVNPILSLIYAEDFDTHMRDSKQYENHRLLIDKGLKVTFYWPKTYQGRELTSIEKATVSKAVAKDMNDFITRNYDKLKDMDKNKAQELLDKRKSKYQNIERKKYLK